MHSWAGPTCHRRVARGMCGARTAAPHHPSPFLAEEGAAFNRLSALILERTSAARLLHARGERRERSTGSSPRPSRKDRPQTVSSAPERWARRRSSATASASWTSPNAGAKPVSPHTSRREPRYAVAQLSDRQELPNPSQTCFTKRPGSVPGSCRPALLVGPAMLVAWQELYGPKCPSQYVVDDPVPAADSYFTCAYGSAASRRPSPRKLNARTATITGIAGISIQGVVAIVCTF